MKGIVFTEFIEMVEDRFTPAVADRIIGRAQLANGGAYTAVGTYEHAELVRLVQELARETGLGAGALVRGFGEHLAGRFAEHFPQFFAACPTLFDFLASVDGTIHVEVRKLYPDAELPAFDVESMDAGRMAMVYRSARRFEDLAEGLIVGSARHYRDAVDMRREAVTLPAGGAATRFVITRRKA